MNLYRYMWNNPARWVDPRGLWSIKEEYELLRRGNYNRNVFNENISYEEIDRKNWDSSVPAKYHQQGTGNEGNVKYLSPVDETGGSSEAIFKAEWQPVTDPVNGPTYNFADPRSDPIGHFFQDMIPYYIWGTSHPTKWYERIFGTYEGETSKSPCSN